MNYGSIKKEYEELTNQFMELRLKKVRDERNLESLSEKIMNCQKEIKNYEKEKK